MGQFRRIGLRVLIAIGGLALLLWAFVGSTSLWYGSNMAEYAKISAMAQERNVGGLNETLVRTRSIPNKLVLIDDLGMFRDTSSVKPLVGMLSYDLPWWVLLDSEMDRKPMDVRLAALNALFNFEPAQARGEVLPLLANPSQRGQLYGAALLMHWGDPRGQEVMDRLSAAATTSGLGTEIQAVRRAIEKARLKDEQSR